MPVVSAGPDSVCTGRARPVAGDAGRLLSPAAPAASYVAGLSSDVGRQGAAVLSTPDVPLPPGSRSATGVSCRRAAGTEQVVGGDSAAPTHPGVMKCRPACDTALAEGAG